MSALGLTQVDVGVGVILGTTTIIAVALFCDALWARRGGRRRP